MQRKNTSPTSNANEKHGLNNSAKKERGTQKQHKWKVQKQQMQRKNSKQQKKTQKHNKNIKKMWGPSFNLNFL